MLLILKENLKKKIIRKYPFLSLYRDVINLLSEQSGQSPDRMRLWPMNHRTNQTLRPTLVDHDTDITKPVFEVADNTNPWTIFLEIGKEGFLLSLVLIK